ncbi:hypothetical protein XSR1_90037 [Xenorhabdus szentirmaii DSM 16338]|uniref:Uncharacterized protein n=1 Tax=Xenorhabdus szentirmaii DSM 16338 TaxID=1427518 RepID=W1J4K2_9GAMM|nr:hypothetical protein XSR1_90037 [Xenorhabdus szentirmaii DSM 16338]
MANETRTRDDWNHNPGLYQLSYSHHNNYLFSDTVLLLTTNRVYHDNSLSLLLHALMARPTGFEPETSASGEQRSIQLSYGRLTPLRWRIVRI